MIIINKNKYNLSHKKISKNALKVLYRLNKLGYQAYLVGGSIRDLLLKKKPKDFDIATNAKPKELKKIFNNCRLIGKRFLIVHIFFTSEIIEVSTFRKKYKNKKNIPCKRKKNNNKMLLTDNNFGKIEEDAINRDITINSLYYDIFNRSLRDYVNGFYDFKKKIIRIIGNAETRYQEDPIRILRVVYFSVKLEMKIEKNTEKPIKKLIILLKNVSKTRLLNEIIKILINEYGEKIYKKLEKYNFFKKIISFPYSYYSQKTLNMIHLITIEAIKISEKLNLKKKKSEISFLFSTILWYPLLDFALKIKKQEKISFRTAFKKSIQKTINKTSKYIYISRKNFLIIKNIWKYQLEFNIQKNLIKKKLNKNIYFLIKNFFFLRKKIINIKINNKSF
ncbi:polynucleotide adenylyltransferase PcnB [Buchnera aphidicola]|uniref:polynucleotide adenylyltransferase PcnB n=1 Tax=Buchnera aphidicola TaxID=9 RepID=UPI00346399E6